MTGAENAAVMAAIVRSREDETQSDDIATLLHDLQETLGPELLRNEVVLKSTNDGLVISLGEIGFFESGSAQIRDESLPAFGRIASCFLLVAAVFVSKAIPITFQFAILGSAITGSCPRLALQN